ncbi:hypothetical protein DICVIV_00798 [Dictyocaulus viviparus]|uniref:Uncharacterized protein n=1 Tax=Dictyocaulus viviparus TaxID=29172 RepID=A0A0D8YAB0_DICVI|nr:hypothetical protein DICVIV_00798 [Dictyocaulus viviparus]
MKEAVYLEFMSQELRERVICSNLLLDRSDDHKAIHDGNVEYLVDACKSSNEIKDEQANCEDDDKPDTGKRKDYLSWEDYFMAIAKLASMRSKDPVTQSRLVEVVYLHDRLGSWSDNATRRMFDLAGLKYRRFETRLKSVTITF